MLLTRLFRNDDVPALAAVWNDTATGRGAYSLRGVSPMERAVFSKPYFDPAGLIVGEVDGEVAGFAHAGFGPNADETALDRTKGVVLAVAVCPRFRRRGFGMELLQRAESYLFTHGCRVAHAGPTRSLNPFYFGLYGGSDAPGFLFSDHAAGPFFENAGYTGVETTLVFQRKLDRPLQSSDSRFLAIRRRHDAQLVLRPSIGTWWSECVLGLIEPVEFRLEDKTSGAPVARASAWEMEGYSLRWNLPAVGLLDIHVRSDLRRQGLAKYLLTQLVRNLQEQYFGILEVQVPETNQPAIALFRQLDFEQIDVGRSYSRDLKMP